MSLKAIQLWSARGKDLLEKEQSCGSLEVSWYKPMLKAGTCKIRGFKIMIVLVESTVLVQQSSKNIKNRTQHPRDTPLRNLQILAPTDNGTRRTIDFATYLFISRPRYIVVRS